MRTLHSMCLLIAAAVLPVLTGCGDSTGSDERPANPDTTTVAAAAAANADDQSNSIETADSPDEGSAAGGDAQPQEASAAPATETVMLGSPDLTAGIPGEGPLTIEQIREWLDDPTIHVELQVELPLGLAAGKSMIKGLEENLLTRAKIELGRQLYFEPRLSSDSSVSCATCHDPAEGYTTHTQFGVGIGGLTGGRNSPVAYNRILSDLQFWDGRSESLEEQAKGPIANPIEMGNTHEACEACVNGIEAYRIQFEKIFPDEGVNMDTVAKAIASFERAIVTGPSPFDYYERLRTFTDAFGGSTENIEVLKEDDPQLYEQYQTLLADSEAHPISDSAKRGRNLFFSDRAGCTACHVGANLTDEKYHNLGVGMDKESPDLGRYELTKNEADRGAFKTPTIRNVTLSAPYMHDGSQATLEDVVEWYDQGGHPNPNLSDKIKKLDLTDQEKQDLVAFMQACEGPFPEVETGRLPE
ncbi:MAG: cytochrome c peroxidase [Pirellulales bacterium]